MCTKNSNLIRFDTFMHLALHDPDHGYYARNIQTVGSSGDFSTTATLSSILGKAIAESALTWAQTNKAPLNLIEIGGGDGSLAESIIKSLPFLKRRRLNYNIVDSSSPLTKNQKKRNISKRINWHIQMNSALKHCEGKAFIFSNELVDAFPVRIFRKSNTHWEELYIEKKEEHFIPLTNFLPNSSALNNKEYKIGQRIETHESYREWLHEWLPAWHSGELLTIDYGDIYPEIYYRMPHGTLRAYSHHQRITGKAVYCNLGRQDITADVNFTDLINWGEQDGLEKISLTTQQEYLLPYVTENPEDQFLIHPNGAGSAFKILRQKRNKNPVIQ